MANKIQIRRGLKEHLPDLDVGEPALCTDTKEVFVGNAGGNVTLINKEVMDEHIGNYTLQIPYGTAAGSANAYTVNLNPPLISYTEGVAVAIKINTSNTGASTININGLGSKSIRDSRGNVLTANRLIANSIYTMRFNGTNFILQGEGAFGNATASDLLSGKTASTDAGDITGTMPNRAGDNVNLASFVSGTTLKLKSPKGYYDGIDDTVTITNADFVASNIRSGINLFGITGTALIVDDRSGSPGATTLIAGNMNAGYFGTFNGIYTGNSLSSACGLSTTGTAFNYTSGNISWLKFAYQNKIIFVAQKSIRYNINWAQINSAGCAYGKSLSVGGINYICRLMLGGNSDPSTASGREWDTLMYQIHGPGGWAQFTDVDLNINYAAQSYGWQNICQEQGNVVNTYITRGYEGITSYVRERHDTIGGQLGWRPVLEVV